jgi:hypothetical protein
MKRTIKKVLDELTKEKPDLSYIRGMLEVLVDSEEGEIKVPQNAILEKVGGGFIKHNLTENVDEEIIPDFVKPGPIGKINS